MKKFFQSKGFIVSSLALLCVTMMMLICIMIIYLVVLCTEVMSSLGAFFG